MYLSYQRSLALISKPQISHPFSQQWRTQKKITALMLPSIVELSCSFDLRLKVAKHHFGKKNFVPDNRKDNILILVRYSETRSLVPIIQKDSHISMTQYTNIGYVMNNDWCIVHNLRSKQTIKQRAYANFVQKHVIFDQS